MIRLEVKIGSVRANVKETTWAKAWRKVYDLMLMLELKEGGKLTVVATEAVEE